MTAVSADLDPRLQRLVALLIDEVHPVAVWLFGSRAEGRARPESDYDILVVLPDDAPSQAYDRRRLWRFGKRVALPADVIPCSRAEFEEEKGEIDTLPRAAWLRGRRLYGR